MYILIGWINFNNQDSNFKLVIYIFKFDGLECILSIVISSECNVFMAIICKEKGKKNFLVFIFQTKEKKHTKKRTEKQ